MANETATTETPTEWMLRNINTFADSFPNWNLETLAARLRLAQHLGNNWEMVQQTRAAQGARPPAILPDVRDVIASYEAIIADLRAKLDALAETMPRATMDEAWAERTRLIADGDLLQEACEYLVAKGTRQWTELDRLRAERDRLWEKGSLVVIVTAQALYGRDCSINWATYTVRSADA